MPFLVLRPHDQPLPRVFNDTLLNLDMVVLVLDK